MKICEKCGKEHNGSFGSGRFCSRRCANTKVHSKETKIKISKNVKSSNKYINNPGGAKPLPETRINKKCPICEKTFETYIVNEKIFCSTKCCNKDINYLYRKKPIGGYRKGSGRSKSGWYKNNWCDSTYELAYVIYNLDHNIIFKRNKETFKYIYEEKEYNYLPDFIENCKYIEIKGFKTKQWEEKEKQFPKDKVLKVLYKDDLKNVFKYVFEKYNVNEESLKTLYDNYKPKYEYKCSGCNKIFKVDKKKYTNKKFCSRECAGKYGGRSVESKS